MYPIALRTHNRPVYLDVTLKSILATNLPDDYELLVLDDCSNDEVTRQYLFTDDVITLPTPFSFPTFKNWESYVGNIRPVQKLKGIKSTVEVVQPDTRKGVRGGIFWCVDYMMTRYSDAPGVIIIEADAVFHKKWYEATCFAYDNLAKRVAKQGPNGDQIGIVSCYDRKGSSKTLKTHKKKMGAGWRNLKKKRPGLWNCAGGIGGVMYLITREFYNRAKKAFKASYPPKQRSGDTMLQSACANKSLSIGITVPSYCQHIGKESTAWPEKGWRFTKNFKKPFAFEAFDDEGWAYSLDWM